LGSFRPRDTVRRHHDRRINCIVPTLVVVLTQKL
jgi:hypothetical protein